VREGKDQHQPEAGEDQHADHGEPDDHDLRGVLRDGDGADEGLALPQLRSGDRAVGAGHAERLREVGEPVAALLHVGQEALQGRDRLGAVAAGIVHQHDGALGALGGGALDDRVDAGALPVLGVGVVEGGDVAARADVLGDRPGLVVEGVREGGVRRTEQRGADARGAGERQLVLRQLPVDAVGGLEGQVRVVEGVQADLVALAHHPFDQVRVARGHGAGDEEDGMRIVPGESVEDLRRPDGVRTVVEGQHEPLVGHAERLGVVLVASVDDGTAVEYVLGDLVRGGRGPDAVVGEDLAVHIAAQHEHREQRDEEEHGKQIAHGQSAAYDALGAPPSRSP
jgi:hypothetical protein